MCGGLKLKQEQNRKQREGRDIVEMGILSDDASPASLQLDTVVRLQPSSSFMESPLEALPLDILVRIICALGHYQLKPAFHVCKRLREAVMIARQNHFDLMTPGYDGYKLERTPKAPLRQLLSKPEVLEDLQSIAMVLFFGSPPPAKSRNRHLLSPQLCQAVPQNAV